MTTIAHLSDMHLLEEDPGRRGTAERLRLGYLTFGRPADPARRRRRSLESLVGARRAGADHLVVTGDLTEDGIDAQFVVLGSVLRESGWDPRHVTLVPGNHDAYTDGEAWARALAGPLAAYAATSTPGSAIRVGDSVIVALSTAFQQPLTRSAGALDKGQLDAARAILERERATGRAVVLALHHPPLRRTLPIMQWIDGLEGCAAMRTLLEEHDHAFALHGHTHAATDRPVRAGGTARIFSAKAVVQSATPLRLYAVRHGRLWPERAPSPMGTATLAAGW